MLGLVRFRMLRVAISKYSTDFFDSRIGLSAASRAMPTSAIHVSSPFIRPSASDLSRVYPAGADLARLHAALEGSRPLGGGPVSERLRAHMAGGHSLQTIVPNRRRSLDALSHIAAVHD